MWQKIYEIEFSQEHEVRSYKKTRAVCHSENTKIDLLVLSACQFTVKNLLNFFPSNFDMQQQTTELFISFQNFSICICITSVSFNTKMSLDGYQCRIIIILKYVDVNCQSTSCVPKFTCSLLIYLSLSFVFSYAQIGYDKQGLPIGLQLIGRPWCEATILRLASVIEVFSSISTTTRPNQL